MIHPKLIKSEQTVLKDQLQPLCHRRRGENYSFKWVF